MRNPRMHGRAEPITNRQTRTAQFRRRQQRRQGTVAIVIALLACSVALGGAAVYVLNTPPPPAATPPIVKDMPLREDPLPAPDRAPPTAPPVATQPQPAKSASDRPTPATTRKPAPPTRATPPAGAHAGPLLPWVEDRTARHLPGNHPWVDGSFELATTMPDSPVVRCDWRIPVDSSGRALPTAADIVALFPYPTETSAIRGFAEPLTTRCGFSVLSIRFLKTAPEDGVPPTDRRRWYYFPESGAGAAWCAAITRLREIGGFPQRQIFVSGRSGGGSAAHLFAEAHPELVAGIVQEAGRVHAELPRHPGPMLLAHGHHDYVAEACRGLERKLVAAGSQVTRIGFPPTWDRRGTNVIWAHSAPTVMADVMWLWLSGVANLRLEHGTLPRMDTWPGKQGAWTFPDEATEKAARRITPDRELSTMAGARLSIARPARATTPTGLAIVVINRFETSLEQADLDLLHLADRGVLAIGASSDNGSSLPALRQVARSPEVSALGQAPWVLVVDQPGDINELLGLMGRSPRRVVLFNASPQSARMAAERCAAQSIALTVAGISAESQAMAAALRHTPAIWLPLNNSSESLYHSDRSHVMLNAVQTGGR